MLLTKEYAYRCRNISRKRHLKDFAFRVLFKELLFGVKKLFASYHHHNEICQRFKNEDDQKLDHEHLAKISSILYHVVRFHTQIFQWLDHKFLFHFVLGFKIELEKHGIETTQLLHEIKSYQRL